MGFRLFCTTLLLASAFSAALAAKPIKSERASFELEILAEGLQHPWGLAFLPTAACW